MAIIDPMNHVPSPIKSGPWMLDPAITYLNHGSFGARTTEVFEAQQRYKLQFERSPVDFLDRHREFLLGARNVVADFVSADIEGIGFVENATTGIGCVIQSLSLQKGDEILTTNHVYNGVRKLVSHYCAEKSMLYREIDIPLPISTSDDIIQGIFEGLTNRTKVLIVDHVSSASAIVFPVDEIISICKDRGILIIIDGAHAPGMIDVDIDSLAPDWYVANLHKWVCAPIGTAFVWTSQQWRSSTHPMTVSHWLDQGYAEEFNWQGTRDISSCLTAVDAIKIGEQIGWAKIRRHNHEMATWMHETLVSAFDVQPLSPIDGSLLGSMATVLLPAGSPRSYEDCIALRDKIFSKNALEVPIFEFQGKGMLRVSAQLYSKPHDVERLVRAFKTLNSTK